MSHDPVFVPTYHSISEGRRPLRVSPCRLTEDLDLLLHEGFRAVPLRRLADDDLESEVAGERQRETTRAG